MNAAVLAAAIVALGTVLGSGRGVVAVPCAAIALVACVVAIAMRRARVVAACACIALLCAASASAAWRTVASSSAMIPKLAASKSVVRACGTVTALGPHSVEAGVDRLVRRGLAWRVREPLRITGQGAEKTPVGTRICATGGLRPPRTGRTEPPMLLADTLDSQGTGSWVRRAAGAVRKRYSDAAQRALPRKQAGLLL